MTIRVSCAKTRHHEAMSAVLWSTMRFSRPQTPHRNAAPISATSASFESFGLPKGQRSAVQQTQHGHGAIDTGQSGDDQLSGIIGDDQLAHNGSSDG
jgi:hypothetical protein